MRDFIIALQFLTRISINPQIKMSKGDMASSAKAYPLVGILMGLLLLLLSLGLVNGLGFSPFSTAVLLVVSEVLLTGGLHLDGLMDCADGLLSYLPKERSLAIMKDSQVGANAVLALVSLLLVKIALLVEILPENLWLLVFMPVISRWTLLDLSARYPYAGTEGSVGGTVIGQICRRKFWLGTSYALAALIFFSCSYAYFFKDLLSTLIIFTTISWPATAFAARRLATKVTQKIDGITGDVLGAILELSEVVVLVIGIIFIRLMG